MTIFCFRGTSFPHPSLLALGTTAAVVLFSGTSQAGTLCTQDSECIKGFTCQDSFWVGCPEIACAPGQPCPAPPPCNPTVIKECVPGPCNGDSDCAAGMVCFSQTQTSCPPVSAPTCAPGVKCASPDFDAGACTTQTLKSCVPRYVPPCHVASDCGDGFSCVPDQQCWCTGSAGTGSIDGGRASSGGGGVPTPAASNSSPPSPPTSFDSGVSLPDCGCTTLSTSHCEANMVTCTTASDCPAMWTCVQPPTAISGCAVAVSPDGSTTSDPCVPPTPVPVPSLCEPPYYELVGSGFGTSG